MAQQYPSSWKNCATCAYWTGQRDTDNFGMWSKVDGSTAKGRCMCSRSAWFRQDKQACMSCASHEIWPVLRK